MPIINPAALEGIDKPELIFGLVAPVGTPLRHLSAFLIHALRGQHGYEGVEIYLSQFLTGFNLPTPEPPPNASEYERLNTLMTRGNELREAMDGGEALALLAAVEIQSRRPTTDPGTLPGTAFVLNQLKHPDEVVWLRTIYGAAFQLIGVFCPEEDRKQYLHVGRAMSEEQAEQLIQRDKGEEIEHGQQVTETFQHCDVFIDLKGYGVEDTRQAEEQLRRYLKLLFGHKGITPTREEYGMFLAHSAGLRTADLSRQVGAAILSPTGEVVSLGTNEVPAPGGGQYWGSPGAMRDFERGGDENARIKFENLQEVLAVLTPEWDTLDEDERQQLLADASAKLDNTRMMNLTEFGRAVHAEMEALLSAGRVGVPVRGCELYCTTFPCHNCAKHIIDAGIHRVLYIEPYPKSLAERLHGDALVLGPIGEGAGKVAFEAFHGVAPRMYPTLFSSMDPVGTRITRKSASGEADRTPAGLRIKAAPLNYIQREAAVALLMAQLVPGSTTSEE
jgi:deoxycytidylate deaminase